MPVTPPFGSARLLGGAALAVLIAAPGAPRAAEAPAAARFGAPALPAEGALQAAPPAEAAARARTPAKPAAAPWLPPPAATRAEAVPAGAAEAPAAGAPDLGPLRYYAAQSDLARVAAEIRLLRGKYPGWEPPTDLFTEAAGGESEQPLWDLFGRHDLAGLRAAIAERQARAPGWQPSADLAGKLEAAEAADALVAASDAKDYAAVVEIAANHPALMACGTVDAIWRTAEALALTGDQPRAAEAYRSVLTTCTVPAERLATMQKARAVLTSPEAVEGLMRLGRRLPGGTAEFAGLLLDDARRRIGEVAAGTGIAPPSPRDLEEVGARARAAGGAADAELLGWYALSRKDYPGAEGWFRGAMAPTPTAKAAEGLVLALRDGGKLAEAVRLAPGYAALGSPNRKLATQVLLADTLATPVPAPEQLAALGAAIDADQAADAAQSLGWARFKIGDVAGAEGWFRKSLAWQPGEAAAVGAMVVARRLRHGADYAAVVSRFKASFPRVAELDRAMGAAEPARPAKGGRRAAAKLRVAKAEAARGGSWDKGAAAIVDTFNAGNVREALTLMDARKAGRAEPKGLSVVRGWALYKTGDYEGARQVFSGLKGSAVDEEAGKGLRQIDMLYTNPRFR